MRKIVSSRTLTDLPGRNVEVATREDLATTIQALKEEAGKDPMVYGGANFVSCLIEQNLIDEYHLFVVPVALGSGLRILTHQKPLVLTKSAAYQNLVTINAYCPA